MAVRVGIAPADRNVGKIWVVVPSSHLIDKTGLSSGYAVVAAVDSFIMMINISEKPAFLRKGSVVGRVEEVSSVTYFDINAPICH